MPPRSLPLAGCLLLLWATLALAPVQAAEPERPKPLVALVPLGKVHPEFLERVTREIEARMNVRVRVEPPRPLPKKAYYPPRKRWRAEILLDWLEESRPEGAWKVVAVTEEPISTTKGEIHDWGIAGLGNVDGVSCVLSAYLYKKHSRTQEVLLRRLGDVAVHEFGHTLGMGHCEEPGCVMSDAKGKAIASADASTGRYCPRSIEELAPDLRPLMK